MANIFSKTDGNFARVLPEQVNAEVTKARAMLAQTQAEGDKPFAGSSYERALPPAPTSTPMSTTPTATPAPTTNNPYDAFGMLLQEELKKAQTINTTDLLKQQRELQRQRIAKIQGTGGTQISDEERRFLSPTQQSSIRTSGIDPTETAIDEVQYQIEEKNQLRKDLIEQILMAKDAGDKARESALEAEYKKADMDFREAQLAEQIRSNKASEGIAGQKASGEAIEGGYTEKQNKVITAVNDKISKNAVYASTVSMNRFGNNVKASLSLRNGVGDIAAINQFQKVVDEGAVTRDQDVLLVQSAQSLLNTLGTKIKGLQKGDKLSETQRTQITQLVDKMYAAQVKALNNDPYIKAKTSELNSNGIDPNDSIIGELGAFGGEEDSQGGGVDFSDVQSSLDINDNKMEVYIPRDVWNTLGARKDALIKDVASDGYKLLVK